MDKGETICPSQLHGRGIKKAEVLLLTVYSYTLYKLFTPLRSSGAALCWRRMVIHSLPTILASSVANGKLTDLDMLLQIPWPTRKPVVFFAYKNSVNEKKINNALLSLSKSSNFLYEGFGN